MYIYMCVCGGEGKEEGRDERVYILSVEEREEIRRVGYEFSGEGEGVEGADELLQSPRRGVEMCGGGEGGSGGIDY